MMLNFNNFIMNLKQWKICYKNNNYIYIKKKRYIYIYKIRRFYCIFPFSSAQAGRSGKTVPELEKTIGLMKKVVERVQRENEDLKKSPAVVSNEKLLGLEQENERLKVPIYLK